MSDERQVLYDKVYRSRDTVVSAQFPDHFAFCLRVLSPQRPVRRVLDLGGGTGSYSLALQQMGYEVTLLDFSQVGVGKAAASGVRNTVCADFMAHDFGDTRFDVIFCKGFSPLNVDDEQVFSQVMARIDSLLAPGGGMIYWARTDDSGRWTDSGWYCWPLARFAPHFDHALLLPKFHRQIDLPVVVNRFITALLRLALRVRRREMLLIATRRRRG